MWEWGKLKNVRKLQQFSEHPDKCVNTEVDSVNFFLNDYGHYLELIHPEGVNNLKLLLGLHIENNFKLCKQTLEQGDRIG